MKDGRSITFSPVQIGTMTVKNRLVAAPMVMNHATEDGHVTPRMVTYYGAKAAGGYGLIQVEASYIRPDGNMFGRMLGVYDDRQTPGSEHGVPQQYLALNERVPLLRQALSRGETIEDAQDAFGIRPLPLAAAVRLQLGAVGLGLQTAESYGRKSF